MSDENNPYELPRPDLSAFGTDDTTEGEGAPPTDRFAAQQAEGTEQAGHPHGSVSYQDAATTHRRPPSLAEQRAREHAWREEQERRMAAELDEAHRRTVRKRLMIGGGVVVGVAAIIGAWYLLSPDNVTARCTADGGTDNGTVVQDQYCDADYVNSHGGHISNGIIFFPIPGGGYRQYHYYYGGTGSVGQRVTGGSYSQPGNATIRTNSGATVQRGGFGVSGKSGSGSGSGSGGGDEEGGSHSGHSGGS